MDEECRNESCLTVPPTEKGRNPIRHSAEQINRLKYYYEMGMKGCSRKDSILLEKAALETGLSVEQVKVR